MRALSKSFLHERIDSVLDREKSSKSLQDLQQQGFYLRRATSELDFRKFASYIGREPSAFSTSECIPYYFGVGIHDYQDETLCGFVTFYVAYSTWNGRFLFLDRMELPGIQPATNEQLLLKTLAKIAIESNCVRVTWRQISIPEWYEREALKPHYETEVLTLCMKEEALISYAGDEEGSRPSGPSSALTPAAVKEAVRVCLENLNGAPDAAFHYRLASPDDAPQILRLVNGLAAYVNELHEVRVTPEHYKCDGGSKDPLFYCLLMEDVVKRPESESNVCGMAFVYFGFDLGRGRFLYLEDLFIEEAYRKRGGGSQTLKALAKLCLKLSCSQFYWVALDWNRPALNLYETIGAEVQEGVQTIRFAGADLDALAQAF